MLFDPSFPTISRKDWLQFSSGHSMYFSGKISRENLELPYWLVPTARGVVLPSLLLLRRTGYTPGAQLLGWVRRAADDYQLTVGKTRLRVRRSNDGCVWIISRWPDRVPMHSDTDSETLVHLFGSTPLVANDLHVALHLAYWFHVNPPIAGLRWRNTYSLGALTVAIRRALSEKLPISWDNLWASAAHSRRMKSGRAKYKNSKLLPPMHVRWVLEKL
jgi:hypothetical protein